MLTLTRKSGEQIRIGLDVVITVQEINGNQVKIGIDAPRSIHVYREELFTRIAQANRDAAATKPGDLDKLLGGPAQND